MQGAGEEADLTAGQEGGPANFRWKLGHLECGAAQRLGSRAGNSGELGVGAEEFSVSVCVWRPTA